MPDKVKIDSYTSAKASLCSTLESGKIECFACAHRCRLKDGARGICRVRFRDENNLMVPWGYTAGMAADPIEKKPFFHVLPGTEALSFGMLGCDLHCDFCQNWVSSQTLRDPSASTRLAPRTARQIVSAALAHKCIAVISTYNEPLITAEWAHEVFSKAKKEGLVTGFVSNGHATPEVLNYLRPVTDLFKVDLKSFREESYRELGGKLSAVKDSIKMLVELGFWVEIVTLLVPEFNDSERELEELAAFIASVSVEIPWHITAFHPDYQRTGTEFTDPRKLAEARKIGERAGLQFVYTGNVPGEIAGGEDTACPQCGTIVVQRRGFSVIRSEIGPKGNCAQCGRALPGIWKKAGTSTIEGARKGFGI